MTATETAVQEILKVTGNENAPQNVKAEITGIVDTYYGGKGMQMAKGLAVGLIVDALGGKYGDLAGKISLQLQ